MTFDLENKHGDHDGLRRHNADDRQLLEVHDSQPVIWVTPVTLHQKAKNVIYRGI